MTLHIVADSSARFMTAGERPHVTLAPVTVQTPDVSFDDHPGARLTDFRAALEKHPAQAVAEPASASQLEAIYADLQAQGHQILSIHTSSGIDPAYRHAKQASERFRGRTDIQIVDSGTFSAGLGTLVEAAATAAEAGADLEQAVLAVRAVMPRLYMVFFLDEMTELERNALVSPSQAILGDMLGVMPFLTVEHGRLVPMEKVRNRLRAQEKLIEFVSEFADIERLALLHSTPEPDEEALLVAERLEALYPETPIEYIDYGPAAATYLGLNALGAIVIEGEEDTLGG